MVYSWNGAFEWARPHGRKFKWTLDQLVKWKKHLNYYSSDHIKKTFKTTTQLYPEVTSENEEILKNFYQKRFDALVAPYRMIK